MADGTSIEWTDATWNPVRGCTRVSEGCRNCYAERVARRFSGTGMPYEGLATSVGRWNGKTRLVEGAIDQPLRWKRPRRIFVNSTSDLFHESLTDEEIDRIFAVMLLAQQHTFQVLTKRSARMRNYFADKYERHGVILLAAEKFSPSQPTRMAWPLPNVWLGVSVENQAAADERIPMLLETPAAVRFISAEPLLGPVDLRNVNPLKLDAADSPVLIDTLTGHVKGPDDMLPAQIDWVIAGGESGPGARPMHPDWARSLRDQCAVAGVPYFFKQWGEWSPIADDLFPFKHEPGSLIGMTTVCSTDRKRIGERSFAAFSAAGNARMERVGKRAAGAELDGREHKEFPR